MAHDLMRGAKDKGFWVMEQQKRTSVDGGLGQNTQTRSIKALDVPRQWLMERKPLFISLEDLGEFKVLVEYWYGILDHDGIPRRR